MGRIDRGQLAWMVCIAFLLLSGAAAAQAADDIYRDLQRHLDRNFGGREDVSAIICKRYTLAEFERASSHHSDLSHLVQDGPGLVFDHGDHLFEIVEPTWSGTKAAQVVFNADGTECSAFLFFSGL